MRVVFAAAILAAAVVGVLRLPAAAAPVSGPFFASTARPAVLPTQTPASASASGPASGEGEVVRVVCAVTGCKPLAPFDVALTETRDLTGVSTLAVSVRPLVSMAEVTWSLVVSDGIQVVEGTLSGRAGHGAEDRAELDLADLSLWLEPELLALTGQVVVVAPDDGLHKWVELQVSGVRRGTGPDHSVFAEPVSTLRMIEWNRPEMPRAVQTTRDSRGPVEVLALPSLHQPAGN